jgi:hypothetical protein
MILIETESRNIFLIKNYYLKNIDKIIIKMDTSQFNLLDMRTASEKTDGHLGMLSRTKNIPKDLQDSIREKMKIFHGTYV